MALLSKLIRAFGFPANRAAATLSEPATAPAADKGRAHAFPAIPDAVLSGMLDLNGIVSNWNTGAEAIKGYRADEIIGQHFSRFYTEDDRARGEPERALQTALREGRYEIESQRVRKDGSHFWAHVVIDPIHGSAGPAAPVAGDCHFHSNLAINDACRTILDFFHTGTKSNDLGLLKSAKAMIERTHRLSDC